MINTSMRCLSIILILWFVVCNTTSAQPAGINIVKTPLTKYFDPSEYPGGIQNWSFVQDSDGVLYTANNHGLLEFDGSTWTLHRVPGSTKMRSVFIDANNRIFVGGQGQLGYFIRTRERLQFISLLERLPEDEQAVEEVWKILPYDDKVYFNTSNKLLVLDGQDFYAVKLPGKISRIFKVGSRLIVQFANRGLYEHDGDTFVPVRGTSALQEEVRAILASKDGFLCFTIGGKVFRYHRSSLRLSKHTIRGFDKISINACIRTSSGDIVIGTQNHGLIIIDEELIVKEHLTRGRGLKNRTVHSLMEDNFGNLWVGLNNGINYVELNSPLSLINEESGLEGTGYGAVLHDGDVYLGTNNGLFKCSTNLNDAHYQLLPGSEGQVYNISVLNDDLILNHHRGAFQVVGNELIQIHTLGSWRFMATSSENKAIGGDYNGICFFEKKNGVWHKLSRIEGVEESSRVFEFENDSTLWMTHGYKGAYRISFDAALTGASQVDFYGEEHGFPSNILISVYKIDQNLIFTGDYGIYNFNAQADRFDPNPFLIENIGNKHVSKIVSSEDGDIYFLMDGQFGHLKRMSLGTYEKEQNVFKRINKLLSDDLENISILDDRNILIGAKEGFIHFDPRKEYKLIEDFNVVLKKIELKFPGDSSATVLGDFVGGMKIERNSSVRFQYASPYFDGFEDLQYSYRLVGFDDGWAQWTSTTMKEYTNLPAGDYEFQVKARNIYKTESETLSSSFRILPRWYESGWAYVFYVFSAFIVFGLTSYFQDKKHKKEKEALYQSKEAAIQSKNAEISQVSRQSKAEIQQLKNEKLKSEIKYKNNELASVTMHLLNKNEFVLGVRKRIESILQENGSSNDELKRILKTIEKNLKDDDSWNQFAYHFDQVHGDFLKKLSSEEIKLTSQETKLAAYLRMNMSSKEIANLMNISVRGVELGRYRLRKKLKLQRDQNLTEYLLQI